MGQQEQQPFISFGSLLKQYREKNSRSQAEVSSAVEIDQNRLKSYEQGIDRPSEDILFLLIQHFALQEKEAQELWRLAGYGTQQTDGQQYFMNNETGGAKQVKTVAISPEDAKIVYTDMIQVMVNNYGVILNFMQGAGVNEQPLAVSRIGMSKEHARSVIEVLKKTLEQSEAINAQKQAESKPKHLPPGNQKQG